MRQSLAILSFLAGAAVADTIQFVFPGGIDGPSPVATIESVEGSTTSAVVACPTGTPIEECGLGPGLDVEIIGGTRYQASMSAGSVYVSYGCDGYNSAANTMTCTAEMAGQGTQTAVLSGTDVAFITATVAEGAELLSGGASATASASSRVSAASASASTASKSSAAAASSGLRTATASGTAAAGSSASGASATASSAAPQSTGAAARFGIEGAALLALAGAAAVNVL